MRVREKVAIPRIACPADSAVLGRFQTAPVGGVFAARGDAFLFVEVRGIVPVGVKRCNRERDVRCGKAIHQMQVLPVGVGVVATPPVSEGEAGEHRRQSRQAVKRENRRAVVVPVGKDIAVAPVGGGNVGTAVRVKRERRGIVQNRNAVAGADSGRERETVLVADVVFPVKTVERAGSAEQIAAVVKRMANHARQDKALCGIFGQRERGGVGCNGQRGVRFPGAEGDGREVAVQNALGGAVVEGARGILFNAEEAVGQNRHTKIPPKNGLRGGTFRCGKNRGLPHGRLLSDCGAVICYTIIIQKKAFRVDIRFL